MRRAEQGTPRPLGWLTRSTCRSIRFLSRSSEARRLIVLHEPDNRRENPQAQAMTRD